MRTIALLVLLLVSLPAQAGTGQLCGKVSAVLVEGGIWQDGIFPNLELKEPVPPITRDIYVFIRETGRESSIAVRCPPTRRKYCWSLREGKRIQVVGRLNPIALDRPHVSIDMRLDGDLLTECKACPGR